MHDVQPEPLASVPDRAPAEAEIEQLLTCHYSVLSPRQVGDQRIRSVLGPYIGPNADSVGHVGQIGGRTRADLRVNVPKICRN
jgi:hypothetical protein